MRITLKQIWLWSGVFTAIALFMLIVRIRLTHEVRFIFLIWNLFLAFIPLLFSELAVRFERSRVGFWSMFTVWLLLFPNAPYIITDLIHLQKTPYTYDVFLIGYFALMGLVWGLFSLSQVFHSLQARFSRRQTNWIMGVIVLSSAFGIYLGRFIRLNSWDVLNRPQNVMKSSFEILFNPIDHAFAWGFTIVFAVFILLAFYSFHKLIGYASKGKK